MVKLKGGTSSLTLPVKIIDYSESRFILYVMFKLRPLTLEFYHVERAQGTTKPIFKTLAVISLDWPFFD